MGSRSAELVPQILAMGWYPLQDAVESVLFFLGPFCVAASSFSSSFFASGAVARTSFFFLFATKSCV